MEQEQTNVTENQVATTGIQENAPATANASSDNFQVTFDFLKTPITQIADYIIIAASKHNTSDIHFDPRENGMMVRFRIDGDLQDYSFIPKAYERNLTTRLKLLANMNITESRLPQDGAIKGMFGDTYLDMRVSCLPLNEGEKIVIRILDYTRSLQGIDSLGFHPDNLAKLKRMMAAPNGIILTTGATGSGKSTTTYSILQGLNTPETNIITVEDPIEMNIQGINQVQVNSEIGMTFAAALRSILRQDPNVILIGEIRDSETAQIAVRAAITGHLVLSTIHTNNSLSTIERLMDMDVERYLLSTALVGIISQRLAKGICPKCRFQRKTTPYEQKIFRNFLKLDVKTIWDANPKGCPNCRRGYKGRIAIQEVLELDDDIRTAISNPKLSKDELRKMVYTDKTITMLQDALIKCINGETNFEEVYRVIEMENDDDEDYESELTAVINENVENVQNNTLGTAGAEILDKLQQAASDTIKEQLEKNQAQIVSTEQNELGNVVDNLQQPTPEQPKQETAPETQPEPVQEQPTPEPVQEQPQPEQQPTPEPVPEQPVQPEVPVAPVAEAVPQAVQPTDQYITNPEAERQDEIPEIVQSLPVEQQQQEVQEEVVEPSQEVQPEVPEQPQVEETPIEPAHEVKNETPISDSFEAAIENAQEEPLEVTIVQEPTEPLSEDVVEVPTAQDNYIPVEIPEVEPEQYVEPQVDNNEEISTTAEQVDNNEEISTTAEQVDESVDTNNVENNEVTINDNTDQEEQIPLSDELISIPTIGGDEQTDNPLEAPSEEISTDTPEQVDESVDTNNIDNNEVITNDNTNQEEQIPLSDELISIPTIGGDEQTDNPLEAPSEEISTDTPEQVEENVPLSEELVTIPTVDGMGEQTDTTQENINEIPVVDLGGTNPLEDMFNGNVLVNDDGTVEQQEEKYSVYDFKNNQDMQFNENYEPINTRVEDVQIVPDEEEKEEFNEIVDSPSPDYDINSEVVGITEDDKDDEDEITRVVEYDNNVVEINDTSYELDDNTSEEDKEEETDNDTDVYEEEFEDINEEYNPDMIPQEEEKKDKEVDLSEDIVIDSNDDNTPESDTREAIGSDFVDIDGPLLEEIPRLGTETEDNDDFEDIEIYEEDDPFEDTLEFDPDAFKD